MRVVTSERAFEDIRRNARWWLENHSPAQAARRYDEIPAAIAGLDIRPEQWPLATENEETPVEIREFHFGLGSRGTHRVIFKIDAEEVLVLAVRHAAQDKLRPEDIT